MHLRPRLQAIADLVPASRNVADIGTDHGYLPVFLIQQGRVAKAIAADISAGSLDKAKQFIRQNSLMDTMETRLGNGLSVLTPGEADTIIIAGMGGMLIKDILEQGEETARRADILILQPMIGQKELRHWLMTNGYRITEEELVKEGHRIYEIIVAVPDGEVKEFKNEIYYEIGWKLIERKHPLLKEFVLKKIHSLEVIIANLEEGQTHMAAVRLLEAGEKLKQYREVYHCHVK